MKNIPVISSVPKKYRRKIREKAIERARTRIIIAGSDPATFSLEDLEVVVREEEDKIKSDIKQRGLMVVLAFFGIHLFG